MDITLDILEEIIKKDIQEVLVIIADKTLQKLKQIMNDDWYSKPEGDYYQRTLETLNSATKSNVRSIGNGNFEVEVFFDTNKIFGEYRGNDMFNAHMSLDGSVHWDGAYIEDLMPVFLEEGVNSKVHSYEGIHMVQKTKNWLETELNGIVRAEFAKKGITISVS